MTAPRLVRYWGPFIMSTNLQELFSKYYNRKDNVKEV